MYYFIWFAVVIAACLISARTGLWLDKKLYDQ